MHVSMPIQTFVSWFPVSEQQALKMSVFNFVTWNEDFNKSPCLTLKYEFVNVMKDTQYITHELKYNLKLKQVKFHDPI